MQIEDCNEVATFFDVEGTIYSLFQIKAFLGLVLH